MPDKGTIQTRTVIELRGLAKSYAGMEALKPLDLRVPRGSIVGFLGPNGAGKSTTIKLLLGLIRPTAGSGTVFGLDISRDSVEIRRRVGYLAQQPRFYPELTVRETLRFAARFFFSGPRQKVEARVDEALALVGMTERSERRVGGLSGGEVQRLGMAQAWINRPELLILDEPASALDPMGRRDVLGIMAGLREHSTIFYSTHILDDVQRVSDRVAILAGGELVTEGPIEQFLDGDGGTIYDLHLKGDAAATRARLEPLPWITSVQHEDGPNGVTRLRVTVTDQALAESRLLRVVLADEHLDILRFGRETHRLEDVFMELVGDPGR